MSDPETIGERVRRERLVREMTQRDLARKVGVGVPHISKVEAGRENPSDGLLRQIASVFHSDPDELLLIARRLPAHMIDGFAADPAGALEFLRKWKAQGDVS